MPLFDACMHSDVQRVAELLEQRGGEVNVNKQYPHANNYTTLHLASMQGHQQIASMLLAAGAAVNIYDDSGETPLQVACGAGRRDIAIMLLQAGAQVTGNTEKSNVALAHACEENDTVFAQMLLAAGADPDARLCLHIASHNGYVEMVRLLLNMGVNLNHRNHLGCTPLHEACIDGHQEIVQMLLAAGADWRLRNHDGATPMDKAEKYNHPELKSIILTHQNSAAAAEVVACNPMELDLAHWMRHELCVLRQMTEGDAWNIVQTLHQHGVQTVEDLAHISVQELEEQVLARHSQDLNIGGKAKVRSAHNVAMAMSKAWSQHLAR